MIDHNILNTIWKNKQELRNALAETKDSTLKDIADFKDAHGQRD